MEEKEFCKRLALGGLIQGYFHNLRGTLQAISLQLQMLLFKKDPNCSQEVYQQIEKAFETLQKLQNQIEIAFEEAHNENRGPWDLRQLLEKEILFWEACLYFKHKIKKQIFAVEPVQINYPINLLRGLLCNIAQELFPYLKEKTELKIFIENKKSPKIRFIWDYEIEENIYQRLLKLRECLKKLAKISVDKKSLVISF